MTDVTRAANRTNLWPVGTEKLSRQDAFREAIAALREEETGSQEAEDLVEELRLRWIAAGAVDESDFADRNVAPGPPSSAHVDAAWERFCASSGASTAADPAERPGLARLLSFPARGKWLPALAAAASVAVVVIGLSRSNETPIAPMSTEAAAAVPTGDDVVFADGFESGDLVGWTVVTGDVEAR